MIMIIQISTTPSLSKNGPIDINALSRMEIVMEYFIPINVEQNLMKKIIKIFQYIWWNSFSSLLTSFPIVDLT